MCEEGKEKRMKVFEKIEKRKTGGKQEWQVYGKGLAIGMTERWEGEKKDEKEK